MPISAQQMRATDLLAKLLATAAAEYPDDEGVGVGPIRDLETGVQALIHLPTGDVFEVVIVWHSDRETPPDGGEA